MARSATRKRVHDAVLGLLREGRVGSLSMEGVAARAGVSKQTLYRSWPTTGAIVFDALLARSEGPDGDVVVPATGDLSADLVTLASGMVSELTGAETEPLLRAVSAEVQIDAEVAAQYRALLLTPQMAAIARRFRDAGAVDPEECAELFVGPLLHRWLLRSQPFSREWIARHVTRTVRATAN